METELIESKILQELTFASARNCMMAMGDFNYPSVDWSTFEEPYNNVVFLDKTKNYG